MRVAIRDAFGEALLNICQENPDITVVDCDTSLSTRTTSIKESNPRQFIQTGSAETAMLAIAAGAALVKHRVIVATFSAFIVGRALDPIRIMIALQKLNVTIVGTHSGLTAGELGWSHLMVSDLAAFLTMPNFRVVSPGDATEVAPLLSYLVDLPGPQYFRIGREPTPLIETSIEPFQVETPRFTRYGTQVLVLAHGPLVPIATSASDLAVDAGFSAAVAEIHCLKPFPADWLCHHAQRYDRLIVLDEHHVIGGLGSLVSQVLAGPGCPVIRHIAVDDSIPYAHRYEDLLSRFHLTVDDIARAISEIVLWKVP